MYICVEEEKSAYISTIYVLYVLGIFGIPFGISSKLKIGLLAFVEYFYFIYQVLFKLLFYLLSFYFIFILFKLKLLLYLLSFYFIFILFKLKLLLYLLSFHLPSFSFIYRGFVY